jgi:hypothetical protein
LLLNGKRISIDGPINESNIGIVSYWAAREPSVVAVVLLVLVFFLVIFIAAAIQQAYFHRNIATWARYASVDDVLAYRKLISYLEKSDDVKLKASTPDNPGG